jgi:plastocyanin
MRKLRNVLLALVAIGIVILLTGYLVLRDGLAADRPPGRVETAVARRLVLLSIPASARAQSNPQASDPEAWSAGAAHFADRCAVCHGPDGRGSKELASRMYPPVPNLADDDIQRFSDGALFAIIQNGVRWTGMPAFRDDFTSNDIWRLVAFVRHIPAAAPAATESAGKRGDTSAHGRSTITMDGTVFTPGELTVTAGETVTWINHDPFPHNATSTAGGFSSGDLGPDERWQFRATTVGRFPYVCTLHPGMKGLLVVQP